MENKFNDPKIKPILFVRGDSLLATNPRRVKCRKDKLKFCTECGDPDCVVTRRRKEAGL